MQHKPPSKFLYIFDIQTIGWFVMFIDIMIKIVPWLYLRHRNVAI